MNLRNFLSEVDKITGRMSKEELAAFVHENARLLSETVRGDYLDRLKSFDPAMLSGGTIAAKKSETDENFEQTYLELQEKITQIEEGEFFLKSEFYCEYNDWDDDDDEVRYTDSYGIGSIIEEASRYIHKCVDCEKYAYGYQIAKRLIGLEIETQDDEWVGDYDSVLIGELIDHGLFDIDYKQTVIDGLYLAYCANENMTDRAEALYRMIEFSHLTEIRLEMVMQNGEELTDIGKFLPIWTSYLGKVTSIYAQNLLEEAIELTEDSEARLDYARQFCDLHPGLYEQYLDSVWEIAERKELFDIGNEALEKIDNKYIVRSRIAKRLSVLALKEQKKDAAERYWLEAFRSETTATNYLRLLIESGDSSRFLNQIREICHGRYEKKGSNNIPRISVGELMINNPDYETVYMLAFFNGEFQYVKEHAMNVRTALGWSATFMKCGLAAFLLLLTESDRLQEGGMEMCRKIVSAVNFDKDEYQYWSGRQIDLDSEEWFWECFKSWKGKTSLSDEQKQEYLYWIEKLIEKRVNGIMEGNKRNYYGECAAYIAALGEVVESRGSLGAKESILLEYKEMYSRRSAFHEELRKYGMPDTRKRRKK